MLLKRPRFENCVVFSALEKGIFAFSIPEALTKLKVSCRDLFWHAKWPIKLGLGRKYGAFTGNEIPTESAYIVLEIIFVLVSLDDSQSGSFYRMTMMK